MTTEEIKTPEVIEAPGATVAPATPAPLGQPPEQGIGDLMKESTRKAIAALVVLMLVIAYLGGLAYAEVHGLSLLRSGVAPDLLMWAYLGMFTLGLLAVALPLALHYWAFDPLHRIVTFIFYGFDLALLGINSFTDFNINEGQQLVEWAQYYRDYVLPSTPVIAAVMATTLLLLNPHARAFILRHALRAAIMQKQADLVIKAANNPEVMATVHAAAQQEMDNTLTELFGYRVTPADGYILHKEPAPRGGLVKSFFDWLSERVQSLALSGMPGQPQPSTSEASQDEPSQDEQPQP